MRRIFLSFLVIFLINPQPTNSVSFALIFKVFEQAQNAYSGVIAFQELYYRIQYGGDRLYVIEEKLDKVIHEVEKVGRSVADMDHKINEKIDIAFDKLYMFMETTSLLYIEMSQLNTYMTHVNYLFGEVGKLRAGESYQNATLKNFIDSVFYNPDNLPKTLYNIFQLINPSGSLNKEGFLLRLSKHANVTYKIRCSDSFSPQQNLYYTYIIIILTEIKAFTAISHAHVLQYKLERKNFTKEYIRQNEEYTRRLEKYGEIFMKYMSKFSSNVRRCNIDNPKNGENYIFFKNFMRTEIIDESYLFNYLEGNVSCRGKCEDFKRVYNPAGQYVSNCETLGSTFSACGTKQPSLRFYEWIDSRSKGYFGHDTNNENCVVSEGSGYGDEMSLTNYCDSCLCTVETVFMYHCVRRISYTPQISNISQDMIVVGVRFIYQDMSIHLQIKHAKLTENGIDASTSVWKTLHVDENGEEVIFDYGFVGDKEGNSYYMYLDDVFIPSNHVVTGVRFAKKLSGHGNPKIRHDKGFQMEVFSAAYDYRTNKISSTSTRWNKPGDFPINATDYQRPRIEINLEESDNPLRATDYYPDPESNKKVKFQVTSRKKDVGQSVIPYFDAQPVEVKPEFPLNGIGLFLRYRSGFGGYIAPRLFTYDMTEIIESFKMEQTNVTDVTSLIDSDENQTDELPTANNGKKKVVTDSSQNQSENSPEQNEKIEVDINSNENESSNLPITQDQKMAAVTPPADPIVDNEDTSCAEADV